MAIDMTTNTITPKGSRAWRVAGIIAVAIAAVLVPFVFSNYQILQATMVVSYVVALLGLNILTGYNGQISLGRALSTGSVRISLAFSWFRLDCPIGQPFRSWRRSVW